MNDMHSHEGTRAASTSGASDPDARLSAYIDVVNRVFGANRQGYYGQVMRLRDRIIEDELIAVGLYRDDADEPDRWYAVETEGGTFELTGKGKPSQASLTWRLSEEHLVAVIDAPQHYLAHPGMLELNWLQARVGLN